MIFQVWLKFLQYEYNADSTGQITENDFEWIDVWVKYFLKHGVTWEYNHMQMQTSRFLSIVQEYIVSFIEMSISCTTSSCLQNDLFHEF